MGQRQKAPRDSCSHRCIYPVRDGSWRRCLLFLAVFQVIQVANSDTGGGNHQGTVQNSVQVNHSESLNSKTTPPLLWPGDSDDDGEDDSSDESEYESWMNLPDYPLGPQQAKTLMETRQQQQVQNNNVKATSNGRPSQSQPLKTLEKLQQMLDDTDYMTAKPEEQSDASTPLDFPRVRFVPPELDTEVPAAFGPPPPLVRQTTDHPQQQQLQQPGSDPNQERLWTSADRSKYKQQQKRWKRKHSSSHAPPNSDDELSDTDDGLGYTLPNLPIYLSDAEGDSDVEDHLQRHPYEHRQGLHPQYPGQPYQQQQQHYHQPPLQQQTPPQNPSQGVVLRPDQSGYAFPPQQQHPQYPSQMYPPELYNPQQQQVQQHYSQVQPYQGTNVHPPNAYGSYPYQSQQGQYGTQTPHQQQQQVYAQQFAAWAAAMGYTPPPPSPYGPKPPQSWARPPAPTITDNSKMASVSSKTKSVPTQQSSEKDDGASTKNSKTKPMYQKPPTTPQPANPQFDVTIAPVQRQSLAEMSSRISFDSIQKLSLMMITAAMACYAAVSPRTLPQIEYNAIFYDNLRILAFILIAPIITFFSVLDAAENDLNQIILALFTSFSWGYILAFGLEILSTTLVRLSVFLMLEPDVFDMVPKIPVLVLPWVLRENRYRPKRITLFAADFLTSCVACPFLEEYVKLKILQWTSRLPKNYAWFQKAKSGSKRRKKWKREIIVPGPGKEVTNVNKYVSQMLAVSIGLKLADAGRRVLMYTKPHHADKSFYAVCRGIFPIQELCGVMTALRLAKRDVLGAEMATWWILAPSVIVHGMANFRGMKPIFKWNSATPWSEMQLSPWSSADASTLPQLASKGFSKLMWLIILMRALGYCAKNYYYTNRQAEKRTTTYAGNPSAVDAALASSDLLKKAQGKK